MGRKLVSYLKLYFNEEKPTKFFFIPLKSDVRPARRHGVDKKEAERDRSPVNDYFDRGRDVTRYPVDPNGPPARSISAPYRWEKSFHSLKNLFTTFTLFSYRPGYPPVAGPDRANDCEIIVVNKKQT